MRNPLEKVKIWINFEMIRLRKQACDEVIICFIQLPDRDYPLAKPRPVKRRKTTENEDFVVSDDHESDDNVEGVSFPRRVDY